MARLNMKGPYKLTTEKIDEVVTKTSAGNYAFGRLSDSSFHFWYVGRCDDDVNKRLKAWVGKSTRYTHFKFSYATSPKAAFKKECKNWHDFNGGRLDNKQHPERPDGTDWKCARCTKYG